jgi:hypothetical protein
MVKAASGPGDCQIGTSAEGQAQIALAADGHEATNAQHLLRFMQRNLDLLNSHRQLIVRGLSRGPDKRSLALYKAEQELAAGARRGTHGAAQAVSEG